LAIDDCRLDWGLQNADSDYRLVNRNRNRQWAIAISNRQSESAIVNPNQQSSIRIGNRQSESAVANSNPQSPIRNP
jgi:hypothetical protein